MAWSVTALLLLAGCQSVVPLQLNLEASLGRFTSTLEQYATLKNDLVFVLDESGSIGASVFPHEVEMVEMIARLLTVSQEFTRVALVTFSNGYVKHLDYIEDTSGYTMCSLIAEVKATPYRGGGTQTSVALGYAEEVLYNARPNSNRIVILISDGESNYGYSPIYAAQRLRSNGVIMFAVGVASINKRELYNVATSPSHVYMLKDFNYIKEINQKLRTDITEVHFDTAGSAASCPQTCDSNAACACGARGGSYQCVCKPGYAGKGGVGQCLPCPRGTYKSGFGEDCLPCPSMSTTVTEGATSLSQCSCLEGHEGDPEKSRPCSPIVCAKLSEPQGGSLLPPDCRNTYNTSCHFMCKEGYCPHSCDAAALAAGVQPWNKKSKQLRTCQADKMWSGEDFFCEQVRCSPLRPPRNGTIVCTTPSIGFGTHCRTKCNPGYILDGRKELVCQRNGQWDGTVPQCLAVACPALRPTGRLRLHPPTACRVKPQFGTTCVFSCEEGFALIDRETRQPLESTLQCLADRTWSRKPEAFTCKDDTPPSLRSCPPPIHVETSAGQAHSEPVSWTLPEAEDNSGIATSLEIVEPAWLTGPPEHFPLGETRVRYIAEDTAGLKSEPCEFSIFVIDNEPPRVAYCPDDIITHFHRRESAVTWEEPEFVDNDATNPPHIAQNRESGSLFSWGPPNNVEYTATDAAGNSAACTFTVIVKPYPCQYVPAPKNGYVSCDSDVDRQFCRVGCHEGYDFVFPPESLYRCKQLSTGGNWTTFARKSRFRFPWPDCAVKHSANKTSFSVTSRVATTSCNIPEEKLKLIKKEFYETLRQKFKHIQGLCDPDQGCTEENVHIECRDAGSSASSATVRRVRRELPHALGGIRAKASDSNRRLLSRREVDVLEKVVPDENKITIDAKLKTELTVSFSFDLPKSLNTAELLEACEDCKNETIVHPSNAELTAVTRAVESAVTEALDAVIRDELPDAVLIGTESTVGSQCNAGQVSNGLSCVNCPIGTYYVNSTTCLPCPVGTYADTESSMSCRPCPDGKTTLSEKASSASECRGFCQPGTYSTTGKEPCKVCPKGEYQEFLGQTRCSKCPHGLTTPTWMSSSGNMCTAGCPPGTFSITGLLPCSPCPRGKYQAQEGQKECRSCPPGLSTRTSASTKQSDCVALNLCQTTQPCATGATCVDTTHSYKCHCPDGLEGADCEVNINDCQPGYCLNGGVCIDAVGNFTCACAPGYTGPSCEVNIDECNPNPCYHGGTCVDGVNKFVCVCPSGFTGNTCKLIFRNCASNPCQNGGTCFDSAGDFRCCCPNGFTGKSCELREDPCSQNPCQNGGQCKAEGDNFQCICADGYSGEKCENNIDECASAPCLNGATCIDGVASFTCQCLDLYEGSLCETAVVPSPHVLHFPNGYVSDYASVSVDRNLRALTLSFYMKTSQNDKRGTPVSYAFRHPGLNHVFDNAFTLSDPNRLLLYFYQNSTDTEIAANDGTWHHFAFTWDSSSGKWVFYWDGMEKARDVNLASKGSYMFKGQLVVGQDQDSIGGTFSGLESYAGYIAELNLWDYAMPVDEVQALGTTCGLIGNVVAWYKLKDSIAGNVAVIDESDICAGKLDCGEMSCHCSSIPSEKRARCGKTVSACSITSCQNNQRCYELQDGEGVCECEGFEGKACEYDIDECITGTHDCSHICVNTVGSYNCSCPEGMTLNFDGKTCVDTSYCTQGESAYLNGANWTHDCKTCACAQGFVTCYTPPCPRLSCPQGQTIDHKPGECCPSCVDEPSSCHVLTNETITTFDKLVYPFRGNKLYTLFQDCVKGNFAGYLNVTSTQRSVHFYIHCMSVVVHEDGTILVDNKTVNLPHEVRSIMKIVRLRDRTVQVQSYHGVVLQVKPDSTFTVSAPKELSTQMCGLCGNMNGDTADDLQTRHRIQAKTVEEYVNSWKEYGLDKSGLPLSCQRASNAQRSRAIKVCKILRGRGFDRCFQHIYRPEIFEEACIDHMCSCTGNQLCFCDAFLGFRLECERHNVTLDYLPERLRRLLMLCDSRCPPGMIFKTCGPLSSRACPLTDMPVYGVLRTARCMPGCFCPPNRVFRRGRCMRASYCSHR